MIYTEFEVFYQDLFKDIGNIPETEFQLIKTKLWNTCKKCTKIKVSYKYRKVINELRKWESIAVLKGDKGRSIPIMNRDKYHEKCLELLDMEQFQKLNHEPSKSNWEESTNALHKIKSKLSVNKYKQIYLTSLSPANSMEQRKSTNSLTRTA